MTGPDPFAVLNQRIDVLKVLASGPAHKPTLVDELDVSRSTVDRALREVADLGYVRRTDAGYGLTAAGRLAARAYRDLERQLDAIDEARPLFGGHAPEDLPDPAVLVDADIESAEPPATHRPLERVKDVARRAERYRGLSLKSTDDEFVDIFYEATLEGGADVEFIFAEPMAEYVREKFTEAVREMMVDGAFRMFAREAVPYGLALAETPDGMEVCFVLYEETGDLAGIVWNDTPAAVAWARQTYRTFREDARELDPPEADT